MLYPVSNDKREVYNFNGVWEYALVADDYIPAQKHFATRPMAVPASYNEIVTDIESKEYAGKVLYERSFSLPQRGDRLYRLRIGAASHKCDVYLNGEKIGSGINGFYPVDLPLEKLQKNNRLSVVIDEALRLEW